MPNFNKFVKTAALYADKKDQGLLAKKLRSNNQPFTALLRGDVITITNNQIANSKSHEYEFKEQLHDWRSCFTMLRKLFGITTKCCSEQVLSQLKTKDEWTNLDDNSDFIGLLNLLEKVCNAGIFEYEPKPMVQISSAQLKFLNGQQNKNETV